MRKPAWCVSCRGPRVLSRQIHRHALLTVLTMLCLLSTSRRASADSQPFFLYQLTNPSSASNAVVALRIDSAGVLAPITGSPFSTGGTGMPVVAGAEYSHRIAVSRSRARLFAANELEGSIAVFDINVQTGTLVSVPGSPFAVTGWGGNPGISLAVSNDGKFLYGANTSVVSFSVAANGVLTEIGARWNFSSRVNGSAVTDANDYLYLAMSDRVSALTTGSGGLTSTPPVTLSLGNVPTDVALTHAGDTLYVGSKSGINAFHVGAGSFTPIAGTPFFGGSSNLSGLTLDYYDHVLVAYGFNGPILASAVRGNGDALTASAGSPFQPGMAPTGAILSPDGRRLFTSNNASQLDAWSVDDAGGLTHAPAYPTTLGVSSGFSKLVAFPSQAPTPTPALPLGATATLLLALLSLGSSRKRWHRSSCSQSSGS
jgi:Lactonase, 7-bladed beta-propeller